MPSILRRAGWFLLRGLGVPEGKPRAFYKDVFLAVVFIPVAIVSLVRSVNGDFGVGFWWVTGIAIICVVLASERLTLLSAAGLYVVARFSLAALLTGRSDLIWLAFASAIALAAFLRYYAARRR
jgi:hypothetical protein